MGPRGGSLPRGLQTYFIMRVSGVLQPSRPPLEQFSEGSFRNATSLSGAAQLAALKGGQFGSQSGHMPGLQVRSLGQARTEGNQWMFLSLPLSMSSGEA